MRIDGRIMEAEWRFMEDEPYFEDGMTHIPGVPGTLEMHKKRIMRLTGCKEKDISVKDGEVLVKGNFVNVLSAEFKRGDMSSRIKRT